jgi:hypothetical protein
VKADDQEKKTQKEAREEPLIFHIIHCTKRDGSCHTCGGFITIAKKKKNPKKIKGILHLSGSNTG